ncbi:hypothetical protein NH44784_059601 [Achromobacter xylosoxidans NH44784-1996]|nr:hypothetical protein NH44784_059601 [Achromobacter xylosoxidans NH44784-1996]
MSGRGQQPAFRAGGARPARADLARPRAAQDGRRAAQDVSRAGRLPAVRARRP